MIDSVEVSLVQFDSAWLDRETNAKRMAEFVESEAADETSARVVVFPELATTGYLEPHTDADFAKRLYGQSESVPGPTTELLGEVAARTNSHVIVGLSRQHPTIPSTLYNSAVLIGPEGEIIGIHDKVHAALEEKNYYISGNTVDVFETSIGNIGLEICYDVRFPELARLQALKGAELIVSIWSSFVQPNKVPSSSIRDRCATRAMENALFFVGCNRSGRENDRVYYGRSAICAPSGDIIAESETDAEEVIRGTLAGSSLNEQRAYLTVFRDRRPELYGMLAEPY